MCKILTVDDCPGSLEAQKCYLFEFGAHDVDASSPGRAKQLLMAGKYDVMIFDYLMKGGNGTGLDLLRWARSQGVRTPCILLSAIDPEDLRTVEAVAVAESLSPVVTLYKLAEPPSILLDTIELLTKVSGT